MQKLRYLDETEERRKCCARPFQIEMDATPGYFSNLTLKYFAWLTKIGSLSQSGYRKNPENILYRT